MLNITMNWYDKNIVSGKQRNFIRKLMINHINADVIVGKPNEPLITNYVIINSGPLDIKVNLLTDTICTVNTCTEGNNFKNDELYTYETVIAKIKATAIEETKKKITYYEKMLKELEKHNADVI